MALCNITGTVYLPDGTAAASRLIAFNRLDKSVVAGYLGAVLPDAVSVVTGSQGEVDVDLITGRYVLTVAGTVTRLNVPDAATADLGDILAVSELPASPPSWYADLLARIVALEAGQVPSVEIDTVAADTQITANTLITGAA